MTVLTITFEYTIEDLLEFDRVILDSKQVKRNNRFNQISFPVILMFIFLIGSKPYFGSLTWADLFLLVFFGVASVLWILFMPMLSRRSTLKKIKKKLEKPESATLFTRREMTFNEKGMHYEMEDSNGNIGWNSLRWGKTENLFLLYTSPSRAYLIPRRSMSVEEENSLETILTEHCFFQKN